MEKIPEIRMPTLDGGKIGIGKQHMVGLLEIDVTDLRKNLKILRRDRNKSVSFTAYIIKAIADCIAENKTAHALMTKNRSLVLFEDVDISLPVERQIAGLHVPFPIIIRASNKKSVFDIHREIENAVALKIENENDLPFLKGHFSRKVLLKIFYAMPQWIRVLVMKLMIRTPVQAKKAIGTVGVTTITMAGRLSGWAFPIRSPYNAYFSFGSVNKKPVVVDSEVKVRDVFNLTVIFNHEVIDGAHAKRLMNSLVKNIERGQIDEVEVKPSSLV